jgi:hypothetical protein
LRERVADFFGKNRRADWKQYWWGDPKFFLKSFKPGTTIFLKNFYKQIPNPGIVSFFWGITIFCDLRQISDINFISI